MASPEHSPEQLAKDLIDQVVRALVAENGLLRDDSNRIRRLTSEAAGSLRRNFKKMDGLLKQVSGESGADHSLRAQSAYREIIATLQFEDIISQVVGHQLERSEITLSILMQIEEHLRSYDYKNRDAGKSDSIANDPEAFREVFSTLSTQIDSYLSKLSASESVKQQTLVTGDTELF